MSGDSPSMELSDPPTPDTSIDMNSTTDRRKSGRAKQKPVLLNKDPNIPHSSMSSGGKRKRVEAHTETVAELSDEDEDESSHVESDPDEEELKDKRRKLARSKKAAPKSAAKKRKTGPDLSANLAMRPAVNGVKKTKKPKQPRARPLKNDAEAGTGLYAEIFAHGHTVDAVAADWITRWERNNTEAMRELINLVIRCTGCNIEVEAQDIEDPDNVLTRLTDIQDEFQAQKVTDYPLISKAKGNASFRPIMMEFFEMLIKTCHASGLLYNDVALYENLEIWVSTMSSSPIRPFRHTATVIALAMGSALCTVANDVTENAAKTVRQKEGEQKKKTVNKERVKALDAKVADEERKRASVVENVQQLFDEVYIHRYRDIDPKVRVECVSALGNWISTLPDYFFEGIYLRYMGWVLSDTYAPTRAEVIKQLAKLFKNKDNVARLRTFTERFRARLVEMAARDSEVSVRASAVELLDTIRKTGLLEPDDIDNVGRLIYDIEPRVRKAVAGFFAENINDLLEATLEDLGGEESLLEILGEEVEEDYETPRIGWLKLKCVAEALESYDVEEEDSTPREGVSLVAGAGESRYTLAAQNVYDGISEVKEWEVLAGYLLYDFSNIDQSKEEADADFKSRCKLTEKEEILLLEVLNVSVKGRLSEVLDENGKKSKRTKAQKEEAKAIQEAAAMHLAKTIPRLLKKFGPNPTTATAVLRLEHVLNLEIFQELRQDSTAYASLLDDINKQFLSHADQGVLAEASSALLHARGFDDLEEVTEEKLSSLWDDTTNSLRLLVSGGIEDNISDLCHTVRRIANLASISDCVETLDQESRSSSSKQKSSKNPKGSARSLLVEIIRDPALDSEAGEEADELLISAMKSLLFYYMWTVHAIQNAIEAKENIESPPNYLTFSEALISVIDSHHKLSPVRIAAISTLLDLHTLFATFRHSSPDSTSIDTIADLIHPVPASAQSSVLSTFTSLEKAYAKKSRKTLQSAPDEDLDSEPEASSDEEDDEDDSQAQQEALMAEKRLCELAGKMVLAIVARVLDHDSAKKGKFRERLQRNKGKLGGNFKEVLGYLDGPTVKGKRKPAVAAGGNKKGKKVITPVEVEEEESEEEEQDGDGVDGELEEDPIEDRDEDGEDARAGAEDRRDDDDDNDIMGD
ncbi:cohesin complex subunit [Lecanora helva]